MRLLNFDTAAEFGESARDWLSADARENNAIISRLLNAERHPDSGRGWLVTKRGSPQLALYWTPPHCLQLSKGNTHAARYAADVLEGDLPGVGGPAHLADAFAEGWSARFHRRAVLNAEMTFYTLHRVESTKPPDGFMRQATQDDFARLAPLATAAARDMNLPLAEQSPVEVERWLRQEIADNRQFMWEVGSSVRALASYADGLSDCGARIRGVYTPPEFRGRGYGTAITGALAEMLLGGGQSWVALFADNANPTSTGIYRRLGFVPQCAHRTWLFE